MKWTATVSALIFLLALWGMAIGAIVGFLWVGGSQKDTEAIQEQLEAITEALETVQESQQELLLRTALLKIEEAGHGK